MSNVSHLPRRGRLFDGVAIALLAFIFFGLAAYHYQRHDVALQNSVMVEELAKQSFAGDATSRTDWPQWRGPDRDGVSTETDFRGEWPKAGPKRLWEKPIGEGHSSIAIVKDRLFTICREDGGEAVVCWDAKTGREIWRYSYPCAYKSDFGNGPRSTPSVDGDFVYAVGVTGLMHCLKAFTDQPRGELVWEKDLLHEFQAPMPQWGVAFSPLVEGNRVFIQPGGGNGNALAALDKRTGNVIWKKYDDSAGYSSPIAATLQGERQIIFFTGTRLVSVDPDTGTTLWEHPWVTDYQCNIATPIVAKDYVFISSGYDHGCALLKVTKNGASWQSAVVYQNRRMRNHFSSCVRHLDYLYGFDDSNLTCMDLRIGKVLWKERGFNKGSVLLAGERLIIYGENGIVALADASPDGYREKSRFQFSEEHPCWSVPIIANARLYVRDPKKLACFDVSGRFVE